MLRNEDGISVVMVFGIMVILGLLAFALVVRTMGERQVVSYLTRREVAFNAAEACLDLAVGRLLETDNTSPIPAIGTWATLPNNALYKTGHPDSVPKEVTIQGVETKKLEDTELKYINYRIRTSGKSERAVRSLEAVIRMGPVPSGTQY
jgi:type II secretory pathway pseudopilin PulG